jgi:hypothetical protein
MNTFRRNAEKLSHFDNLVVEGFLLYDCLDKLEAHGSGMAQVFLDGVIYWKMWTLGSNKLDGKLPDTDELQCQEVKPFAKSLCAP